MAPAATAAAPPCFAALAKSAIDPAPPDAITGIPRADVTFENELDIIAFHRAIAVDSREQDFSGTKISICRA